MDNNYYDILNVSKNASIDDIKKQYKQLALKTHPDKNSGDDTDFKKVQEAYETLSDPSSRQKYDQKMNSQFIFQQFFVHSNQTIADTHYTSVINLSDIHYGNTKKFKISITKTCFTCRENCITCRGSGSISKIMNHGFFIQEFKENCSQCCSLGYKISNINCDVCKNKRQFVDEKDLDIKMPSDCNDGYSLIFYELGEQPNKFGQKAGNLVIKFNIVNDTCFQRVNKHDFLFLQTISLQESFVGKDIAIPHMDGDININIKQFGIINPNKEYIIENKGLCNKGNLRIKFIIQYPDNKVFTDNQISCISDIFKTLDIQ